MAAPFDAVLRARSWLADIFAHNHAEQLRIQREVQRKTLGIQQQDYPYPGAVTSSNNPTTVYNTGAGYVKGALLASALLMGGGAATIGLMQGRTPSAPAVGPVVPATPMSPTKGQDFDAVYEEQQPDGSWKEIRRDHLKGMNP